MATALSGDWGWATQVGRAATASALAALLSLIAYTILYRTLPVDEAGRLALLIALLQTVALVGNLGQPSLHLRLYSRQPPGHFDWLRDLRTSGAISGLVVAAGSAVASLTYGLSPFQVFFLVSSGTLVATLASAAFMLNSQQHYTPSALLFRLPYSLMILPALLSFTPALGRLDFMLLSQFACVVAAAVLGFGLLTVRLERGGHRVSYRERSAGLVFLVAAVTGIVPMQGLIAVAGAFVVPATLAALAALSLLLRPFGLLRGVLQQVLTTELVRGRNLSILQLSGALWGFAALSALAAIFVVPVLAGWAYGSRYEEALGLVPWLTLAGMLTLTETLPGSYMVGRAPESTLNRFVAAQAVIAGFGLVAAIGLTVEHGIIGTAAAGALIFGARNLVAYGFLWWEEGGLRRKPGQAEANSR